MEEIWKDIPDYEGLYQVSNYGNVKSLSRKMVKGKAIYISKDKILKKSKDSSGYLRVALHKNSNGLQISIHQLVAIAFLNHTPNGYKSKIVIDHIDNNRLNNRLDNLQIISQRENTSKDRKGGASKYVGVSWDKRDSKYQSKIWVNRKYKCLGVFESEYDAHIAYQKALQMYNDGDLSFMKPKRYGSSQYKGVSKSFKGWRARININKKEKYLGCFDTELEAHNEVQRFKQQYLLLKKM